jgi:hypothetical protein
MFCCFYALKFHQADDFHLILHIQDTIQLCNTCKDFKTTPTLIQTCRGISGESTTSAHSNLIGHSRSRRPLVLPLHENW